MRLLKGLLPALVILVSACGQVGMGLSGGDPLGATKPTSDSSASSDKTDLDDSIVKTDGGALNPFQYPSEAAKVAGAEGGGSTGSSTTIARIDPMSAQIGSSDIWCPEGADGSVHCPKEAMMMRHGDFSRDNDPTAAAIEKVEYVRVIEVPGDLASSLNIVSADDFLQRVRLGMISDADVKAVTYRDVAVSVGADGSFTAPDLKPGLSLVYQSPAKSASDAPQNYESVSEIQTTVSNAAYLASFRSSMANELKLSPSTLMDVRSK